MFTYNNHLGQDINFVYIYLNKLQPIERCNAFHLFQPNSLALYTNYTDQNQEIWVKINNSQEAFKSFFMFEPTSRESPPHSLISGYRIQETLTTLP